MIDQNRRAGNFNALAANYDRYRIGYSRELYDVLEQLGLRRGATVLDVGCGTGISSEPLVGRGCVVTGLDLSSEMLAAARTNVPSATFIEGRVEELPFEACSFDVAICAQAFHWFDGDRALSEMMRIVKRGGLVAVWWKILGSDDPMRSLRCAAAMQVGLAPHADPLAGGFRAFYCAPLADRTLRVLPFIARFTVDDWIGYERSRALLHDTYGPALEAFLVALRVMLVTKYGTSQRIDVRYSQYLYAGHT